MNNESLKIVLFEPEIPQNTGNIVRLCACTNSELYLIGKLGFSITDKYLKRAGLDYWGDVKIFQYNDFDELKNLYPDSSFYYLSTKASKKYTEQNFTAGSFLVFGSETKGLPSELLSQNMDKALKIPMAESQRSLNLANSVSIVLYEAIRQNNLL
jgi:tRNA (cytidine/uridine-2'-O-)-methyltransferase